ncbi:Csu type fimbrial protein [Blastomonas fulva]|jgi:spore coat protein U-like protein|uniref:Csu type fimbrial protein n=1 Tax=Blastomonas fulva TaxID=1550728 RepID=UPI003D2E1CDC
MMTVVHPAMLPNRPRSRQWVETMKALALAGAGLAGLPASTAYAATATTSVSVTATVQATCLISAGSLAFGVYTGLQLDSTATLTVTCTNTTPYNVGLNAGTAVAATVTTRKMTGPTAEVLSYALFQDTGRTVNWGSTVSTDTAVGTGSGAAQPLTVYGRIAASQFVAPGAYTDTVTATITF